MRRAARRLPRTTTTSGQWVGRGQTRRHEAVRPRVITALAVATVTAALRGILRPAVVSDVSGAEVSIGRPQAFQATPTPAVNIFLYHSQPTPSMRNDDLPTRRSDGSVVTKPRIPLELDYLFTFYGDSANLEPERLFAVTARPLNAIPPA